MQSDQRTLALEALRGDWQGLTHHYAGQSNEPELSSGAWLRCVQAGARGLYRLRYVWSSEDRIREGHLLLAVDTANGSATAAWIDTSLGALQVLSLRGLLDDTGLLRLNGSSAQERSSGEAAAWHWRLEVDAPESDTLEWRMYTTSPQGEEELSVKAEYRRQLA